MTVEHKDILGALIAFIRERFEVPDDDPDFTEDVHLFDYGYVDSFGAVQIIKFIETTYGVEITDQDLVIHPLNTSREIATLVHGKQG